MDRTTNGGLLSGDCEYSQKAHEHVGGHPEAITTAMLDRRRTFTRSESILEDEDLNAKAPELVALRPPSLLHRLDRRLNAQYPCG